MSDLDYLALALLAGQYFVYQLFYEYASDNYFGKTRESIISRYRVRWLDYILQSTQPLLGVQTIRNLTMVHTFLITLSMVMLGGIFSLFTSNLDWINDLAQKGYLDYLTRHPLAIKLLTAVAILLISLFHFVFGLRICFNMNFTVTGADKSCTPIMKKFINSQVKRQARHFIIGVRGMYYAVFPFIWIIDARAMIVLSLFTTWLFYRFDRSVPDMEEGDLESRNFS